LQNHGVFSPKFMLIDPRRSKNINTTEAGGLVVLA
jgi:hypothetical protein